MFFFKKEQPEGQAPVDYILKKKVLQTTEKKSKRKERNRTSSILGKYYAFSVTTIMVNSWQNLALHVSRSTSVKIQPLQTVQMLQAIRTTNCMASLYQEHSYS